MQTKRNPAGIEIRHSRLCPTLADDEAERGDCNAASKRDGTCELSYRAFVYDKFTKQKIRQTFATLKDAKEWREDQGTDRRRGRQIAPSRQTLREVAEIWLTGAEAEPPTIHNRSDEPYKPSALREYRRNLVNYVYPELGAKRLSDIRRGDLQRLVEKLRGEGLSGSKIRNVILPIRVLYRYALDHDTVSVNPTTGLRLPNGHKPRERAASVAEALELLAALPDEDRALWATAFFAGLRRGELRALRVDDVDLGDGLIHVSRSWDDVAGEITPKTKKGTRPVLITAMLRVYIEEALERTGRSGTDFMFGPVSDRPFTPSYIRKRAAAAWAAANAKRKEKKLEPLVPIGLHECRHTCVSQWADAGIEIEKIGDYIGHTSADMVNRYRHPIKGHLDADRAKIDSYNTLADTQARIAQLDA